MKHQKKISGLATLAIAVIIGGGMLWIGVTYTNQQRDKALNASLDRQHTSLLNGCTRGNKLRVSVDNAIRIEHDFLVTARTARLAAAKTATTKADRDLNAKAATKYATYIQQLQTIPLVNCAEAYPR